MRPRTAERRSHAWGRAFALLIVPIGLGAGPALAQGPDPGRGVCAECHEGVGSSRDGALAHAAGVTCLTCHHIGFTSDPRQAADRREEACRGCHAALPPAHAGVTRGAPGCESCHSVHDDPPLRVAAPPSARCASCHERPHALHAEAGAAGPACTACHELHCGPRPGAESPRTAAACASCHPAAHPSHAAAATSQAPLPCTACHSLAPDAPVVPAGLELARACASCHRDVSSTHGAAASCTDCHSMEDPPLPAGAVAIARRCGTCHQGAMEAYLSAGHASGLAAEAPNPDAPTCATCHPVHGAEGRPDIRLTATTRCIACHSREPLARKYGLPANVGASYMEDYHGATISFLSTHPQGEGRPDVMTCSDCHGAHAVGWREDAVLSDTCLSCHQRGDAKLAGAWLGHAPVGPGNRPVIWLVRLFYYVLIPFVLIGLMLNIVFHFVDQRRKGARVMEAPGVRRIRARLAGKPGPPTVPRFNRRERWEHFGAMTSFLLLVVTGLPQARPDLGLAHVLIGLLGGIETTRFVHRVMGFTFLALLVFHVTRAVAAALRTRRLPVMTPTRQDFQDTLGTVRHYIRGTPRPKTGKFDFTQKFEYWGLFLGGILMSVTGTALVFPEFVTRFLPGLVLATFRTMHGLEATFAVLVVALWHAYGVIFRPEIFPLDTSIFTGRVTVERLKEEHRLEYDRLFPGEASGGAEPGGTASGGAPPDEDRPDALLEHDAVLADEGDREPHEALIEP